MFVINRSCCAHTMRAAQIIAIISGVIALVMHSPAPAGSLGSHSVKLRVVDKSGPIWLEYDHVGTDNFGLPSLEIYEKWKDSDDDVLWADVEVKVTIHHPTDDGGGPFKDIWDGIFDNFFGGWGWGKDDKDDDPVDPNYTFVPDDIIIGIDKFVKNKTDIPWDNFLIQLGTGVGNDPNYDPFVPSAPDDGLFIVGDPMPKEVTDLYDPLPPLSIPEPDRLWFRSEGQAPGQDPWDRSIFWFGMNVPGEWFEQDYKDPDYWHARFTIRQHVNIPEPSALALGLFGTSLGLLTGRRRLA